ncbi:MAG: outer membrane protein assembly factor BamA [Arcticibacterium sp.]|jgi:outer membrane protein assembly factor BamA
MRQTLFIFFLILGYDIHAMHELIEEGPLVIGKIEVFGNKKTKNSIIIREMTFSEGSFLDPENIESEVERSRRNIVNTNLFVWVKADYEVFKEKVRICIYVQERLYLLPLPILYLADRSFNEWWYNRNHDLSRVIYGVQLSHTNLSGNGDHLKLKAYGGFVPIFELSYNRPYIDKRQRMGLRGGIFYSTQKSFRYRTWNDQLDFYETDNRTIKRKGAYVEYSLRNALYHVNKVYLGYTETSLSDEAAGLNENYFGTAENFLQYLTFKYDYQFLKVNNRQYPLEGHSIKANMTLYGLGISKYVNQSSINISYTGYKPLGGKLFGSLETRGQLSVPKKQLYPFVSGFGFRNAFVRGYDLNVVDGQHYALLKTDIKYELFNSSLDLSKFLKYEQFNTLPLALYAKVYADAGYVKNFFPELSNSTLSNKLLVGGGVGLDLVSFYDTAVQINYSVNQLGFRKFYFGVSKGF